MSNLKLFLKKSVLVDLVTPVFTSGNRNCILIYRRSIQNVMTCQEEQLMYLFTVQPKIDASHHVVLINKTKEHSQQ